MFVTAEAIEDGKIPPEVLANLTEQSQADYDDAGDKALTAVAGSYRVVYFHTEGEPLLVAGLRHKSLAGGVSELWTLLCRGSLKPMAWRGLREAIRFQPLPDRVHITATSEKTERLMAFLWGKEKFECLS